MICRKLILLSLLCLFVATARASTDTNRFHAFDALPVELSAAAPLELTIQQCVLDALQHNYDVQISRAAMAAAEAGVLGERGAFEPTLFAEAGRNTRSTAQTNAVETTDTDSGEAGIRTRLITGTELSLGADYTESSDDTNGTGAVFARVTQPLLRGAGLKAVRAPLLIARRNVEISEQQLLDQMINTAVSVQDAYWDLAAARERLAVQRESLRFSRDLADLTVQKAEAGLMAESDIVEAQAASYSREVDVAGAEESVRRIEDTLKEQLTLFKDPEHWSAEIIPATDPTVPEVDEDFLPALAEALRERPDYATALLRLKNSDLSLYVAKNGLLPKLDLVASAERTDDAGGPAEAFDAASSDEEVWSVFLRLEIPLGNKSERAALRRQRAEHEQQLLRLKELELRIIREVRRALDALGTSRKIVDAAARTVELEQKKLENERAKLELGKSSTDNVVRFIQSLNNARLRYVQAITGYQKSLINYEQVKGTTLNRYGVTIETYE